MDGRRIMFPAATGRRSIPGQIREQNQQQQLQRDIARQQQLMAEARTLRVLQGEAAQEARQTLTRCPDFSFCFLKFFSRKSAYCPSFFGRRLLFISLNCHTLALVPPLRNCTRMPHVKIGNLIWKPY